MNTKEKFALLDDTINKLHIAILLQRQRLRQMKRYLTSEESVEYIKRYGETKRLLFAACAQREEFSKRIKGDSKSMSRDWPVVLEGEPQRPEKPLKYPTWTQMDGQVQVFMDGFGVLTEDLENRVAKRQAEEKAQNSNSSLLKRLKSIL